MLTLRARVGLLLSVPLFRLFHRFVERYFSEQVLYAERVAGAYFGLIACRCAGIAPNRTVAPAELRTPGDILQVEPFQRGGHSRIEGGRKTFAVLIGPNPFVPGENPVDNLPRAHHAELAYFEPRVVFVDQARREGGFFRRIGENAFVAETIDADDGKHGVYPRRVQALAGAGGVRQVQKLERIVLEIAVAPVRKRMRLAYRKFDHFRQGLRIGVGKVPSPVLRLGEIARRGGSGRDDPGRVIEIQPAEGAAHEGNIFEEPERTHGARPPHVQPVGEGRIPPLAVSLPLGRIAGACIRSRKTQGKAVHRIAQRPRVGSRFADADAVGPRYGSGLGRFDDFVFFLFAFRLAQFLVPVGLRKELFQPNISSIGRETRRGRLVGYLGRGGERPAVSFRDEFVEIHIGRNAPVGDVDLLAIAERAFESAEAVGLVLPGGFDRGEVGQFDVRVAHGGPAVRFVVSGHPEFVHPDGYIFEDVLGTDISDARNGRIGAVPNAEHNGVYAAQRGRSLDPKAGARGREFGNVGAKRDILNVRPIDAVCRKSPVVARYLELVQGAQFDIYRIQIDELAAYHAIGLPDFVRVFRRDRTGGQRHFVLVIVICFVCANTHEEANVFSLFDGRAVPPFAVHVQKHAQVRVFQQVYFLLIGLENCLLLAGHQVFHPQGHGLFARVLKHRAGGLNLADDRAVGRGVRTGVFLVVDARNGETGLVSLRVARKVPFARDRLGFLPLRPHQFERRESERYRVVVPRSPYPDRFDQGEVLYIAHPSRKIPDGDADLIPAVVGLCYDVVVYALWPGERVEHDGRQGQFVLEVAIVDVRRRIEVQVLGVGKPRIASFAV